ncbi:MAG TPA: hypothetical protein VKV80_06330 [Streptosporangiaceae bacterium]|nr:hypothetical protein [Streptosporangiaceae bacterium]
MITTVSRADFLDCYWDYRPGEHVALIQPTGGGKTYMAYQLLQRAMADNPHLSVVSLMPKPSDPATSAWAGKLGLKEIPSWPPRLLLPWQSRPSGYVLWPRHAKNLPPDKRRELVAAELKKGIDSQYWSGNSITFCDDTHSAAVLMGLNPYLEELWVNGRAGGAGLWAATQKPSGTLGTGSVSSFMYSSASHLFLGRDNDERNIRRFGEIGGVDPKLVERIVRDLRVFQVNGHPVSEQLYIDLRGPYMLLIGP